MRKTFDDHLRRKVHVNFPPQRIICLCPSLTETLYALELGREIIGRTRYCVHPAELVAMVPVVGGTKDVDVAGVLDLRPDLVIAEKEENQSETVAALATSVPVYVVDVHSINAAHQDTNLGGSSRMEASVRHSRRAVGYTGLERIKAKLGTGDCEMVNVWFDQHGGTKFVRPSLDGVLDNCLSNPDAWLINGAETFASPGDPTDVGYPMANGPAKDYLNNITQSITGFLSFVGEPGTPGEFLAANWLRVAATDCMADPANPCTIVTNTDLNQELQNWTRDNNVKLKDLPAYGVTNSRVPTRTNSPTTPWPNTNYAAECAYPATGVYSDGSTDGKYRHFDDAPGTYTISGGTLMNGRLAASILSGDFDQNGVRDVRDAADLALALVDRAGYHIVSN